VTGALHLFDACGVEIEYALVDRVSLDVLPIADRVLQQASGSDRTVSDYPRGDFAWSNELVMHVLELKNVRPTSDLAPLADRLHAEVLETNRVLERFSARLMPGGMHPWMNPLEETRVWPHEGAAIYHAYDRIFGCRSHGWANLQSTHVNLPFSGDDEFARLHAALRMIVPILPALAAASPYVEGRATGLLDSRMEAYRTNADLVSAVNGAIVPEPATGREQYERTILDPMYAALAPHDPQGVLRHEWLNARGVIPRFERSALEVRVIDAQECPRADVALAAIVSDLAENLCERVFRRPTGDTQLPTERLAAIFRACVHDADRARVGEPDYLQLMGLPRRECTAGDLWSSIAERLDRENTRHAAAWRGPVEFVLTRGPLARRLLRAIGPRPSRGALHELYMALAAALDSGKLFDP
jgi:gamma-glutamyl:cysteine ligase YbdK (ATP-grasp superfamily)